MKQKPAQILARQKGSKRKPSARAVHQAAEELGRSGGLLGCPARAESLTQGQRSTIASHAAHARWGTPCGCEYCGGSIPGLHA
jgi:hypothetical protein